MNGLNAVLAEAAPTVSQSGAQAVERALMLLSLVGRSGDGGATLAVLVARSGLNKPTARRLLMALMRARLIEQDGASRRYRLGQELYVLGSLAQRRHGLLDRTADVLRRLSARTGDTSFATARHGDHALCLHREEGNHPVRTHALQKGDQHPLGVGAGSLALLAALPEAETEAVIARLAPDYAGYPGYSPAIVREDAAQARARGFAVNPGRVVPSSWGIGIALRFPDGRVAGALSIAAIDSRMRPDRQEELAALLRAEAQAVEARLAEDFGPLWGA